MKKIVKKEYYDTVIKYKDVEIEACDHCGKEITTKMCSFCNRKLCYKCNNIVFDNTKVYFTSGDEGIRICSLCAKVEPFKEFMVIANQKWEAEEKLRNALKDITKLQYLKI